MAKHDQRILKFLNQNADRAPTITEMMTRLNISITDISESLASLQAQRLISKKVNPQGIECWFPGSPGQSVPSAAMSGLNLSDRMPPTPPMAQATAQLPAMGGPIAVEARHPSEARSAFPSAHAERSMLAPDPQPPMPRSAPSQEREARPVQVQHVAVAEAPMQSREQDPPDRNPFPNIPQPVSFNGSAGMYGLAPASKGVGFLTLLAGLVAAVGLSAFISTRLIAKEFKKASTSFVDRKSLADANAGMADFQEKTKAHVTALEAEVKKLTDELAASKASVESSKVAAVAAPAAAKDAAPAAKPAKGAKAAETKSAEAKPAKVKKATASTAAAAKAKVPGQTAMSKAAARGAALRKKSARASAHETSEEAGSPTESASSSQSSESESPSVPNPPGLDDLPAPPAE
jgi:hypothetical protein